MYLNTNLVGKMTFREGTLLVTVQGVVHFSRSLTTICPYGVQFLIQKNILLLQHQRDSRKSQAN